MHRALLVLDKRIQLELAVAARGEDADDEDTADTSQPTHAENALLVIPPGCLDAGTPDQPIFALMAGEGTFSAPPGQCTSAHMRTYCLS